MTLFIPDDRLEVLARKFGVDQYAKKQNDAPEQDAHFSKNGGDFFIEELGDSFVLKCVSYQGGVHTIAWSKELLNGGQSPHTQDGWIDFLKASEWKLPDARLYHAALTSLYVYKDGSQGELVEKVRGVFAKHFEEHWLMTASRAVYKPQGLDMVKHRLSGNEVPAVVVGSDERINAQSSNFKESVEAILGTRNLAEVGSIYEWVSGKKPYLWRVNNRPEQTTERAVVLGVGDFGGGFNISAGGGIDGSWPALGVVVGAPKTP